MPTEPEAVFCSPGGSGLRPCTWTHLKLGVVPYLLIWWGEWQISEGAGIRNWNNGKGILWFKPPFNMAVANLIGKEFFRLLQINSPPSNSLYKIFNWNIVKLSSKLTIVPNTISESTEIQSSRTLTKLAPTPFARGCLWSTWHVFSIRDWVAPVSRKILILTFFVESSTGYTKPFNTNGLYSSLIRPLTF